MVAHSLNGARHECGRRVGAERRRAVRMSLTCAIVGLHSNCAVTLSHAEARSQHDVSHQGIGRGKGSWDKHHDQSTSIATVPTRRRRMRSRSSLDEPQQPSTSSFGKTFAQLFQGVVEAPGVGGVGHGTHMGEQSPVGTGGEHHLGGSAPENLAIGEPLSPTGESFPSDTADRDRAFELSPGWLATLTSALGPELLRLARNLVLLKFGFHIINRLVREVDAGDHSSRAGLLRSANNTRLPAHVVPGLNHYELQVASDLVDSTAIEVTFDDVAGLEDVKQSIQELVMAPWDFPELYKSSRLFKQGSAALLYGPPGCGKTLLAKALARECGACFISVNPSTLFRKYVGDSNQMVRALFSLARKAQPCVIFMDEIDGICFKRGDTDLTSHREVTTELMQLWDGLQSQNDKVVVLGATNRPWDLDPAVQRRFSRTFLVGLPDRKMRQKVLKKALQDVETEVSFSCRDIAQNTEGYSCSDLVELCREAMRSPLREARGQYLRAQERLKTAFRDAMDTRRFSITDLPGLKEKVKLRPLRMSDVYDAQQRIIPAYWASEAFKSHWSSYVDNMVDQAKNNWQ